MHNLPACSLYIQFSNPIWINYVYKGKSARFFCSVFAANGEQTVQTEVPPNPKHSPIEDQMVIFCEPGRIQNYDQTVTGSIPIGLHNYCSDAN